MAFDYKPGNTIFHRLDPRTKILFYIVVMLCVLLFSDPLFIGCVLAVIFMVLKISQVEWSKIWGFLRTVAFPTVVYALFTLLWGFHSNDYILFDFFYFPVSVDGIVYTLGSTIRFLCILLSLRAVLMVTSIKDMILGLVKLGMPVEFGIAFTSGFAYLPVMMDETEKIRDAQRVKGWNLKGNPIKRMRALLKLMIPAIMRGIKRSGDIALALESKGFGYDIRGRTYLTEVKFTKLDYAVCGVLVAAAVFSLVIGHWGLRIADYETSLDLLVHALGINR